MDEHCRVAVKEDQIFRRQGIDLLSCTGTHVPPFTYCFPLDPLAVPPTHLQAEQRKKHGLKNLFSRESAPSSKATRRTSSGPFEGSAPSSPSTAPPLSHSQVKTMNNYVGIGIDAQVAVEFHQIRDSYPALFMSQVSSSAVVP